MSGNTQGFNYSHDIESYYGSNLIDDPGKEKCVEIIKKAIIKMIRSTNQHTVNFESGLTTSEISNVAFNENSHLKKDIHLSGIGYLSLIDTLARELNKKIDFQTNHLHDDTIKELALRFAC